jgi:hypothetical protein
MKKNYTGVFLKNQKHMTWNYGFPLQYPNGVKVGDKVDLTVVGEYKDNEVECLIVKLGELEKQPSGTLLHITTKVYEGGKPVMSGLRATKKGYQEIENYTIKGIWE